MTDYSNSAESDIVPIGSMCGIFTYIDKHKPFM